MTSFVPHNLSDLKLGQHVRFITASRLVNGVVRYLEEGQAKEGRIGVETHEHINADPEWRKYFNW